MGLLWGIISNLIAFITIRVPRFLGKGKIWYRDLVLSHVDNSLEETEVYIPPHACFRISGGTHEIKPGMDLSIKLPRWTTNLIIAGWGVIPGADRFYGSLTDSGKIGELFYIDSSENPIQKLLISLPAGAGQTDLKLADGNPIISGYPSEELVNHAGFLGRLLIERRSADRYFWDRVNLWVSEVRVPRRTKTAVFKAIDGSMNIVHIRAICRFRVSKLSEHPHGQPDKSISQLKSGDQEHLLSSKTAEASSKEVEAQKAMASGRHMDAESLFGDAADDYLDIAYLPGADRNMNLDTAANNFAHAAEAASNLGDTILAAKHYFHSFLTFEQSGSGTEEDLVKRTVKTFTSLSIKFMEQVPINLDIIIETWYYAGFICLEYARQSTSKGIRICYYMKAYRYYLQKIVETILSQKFPNMQHLMFAHERLAVLKREWYKLKIGKLDVISEIDKHLKLVLKALDEYHEAA